ncbi:glycerate kinase [Atopomonas sediminilitoris]|uniref:glycerate kinase n=1 Tax=Atopomonas sediminilitoris TaxID=2919919 RepID=UPI001F4F0A76|nr:glycerate kinase [Atopomonas sediminilitoris]MCJ8170040.1 glycerate kinase [Atopomonas sediminilitoris]
MRVLIAPDAFKDSLSAEQAAQAIAEGWQRARPCDPLILQPMADGGEGSLEVLLSACGGTRLQHRVCGPLGEPVMAQWALLNDGCAVIELAQASGIQHLSQAQRDALHTTSFGTGELIAQALNHGARSLLMTLGGSACNDGGAGLLQALGARLLDHNGAELPRGGAALSALASIDLAAVPATLRHIPIHLACDVDNPLCGPRGASTVFGPQKGASPAQVQQLEQALSQFAHVLSHACGRDLRDHPGAGAAGDSAFALLSLCPQAKLSPGLNLIAERVGFAQHLRQCDLLITGEGRLDGQSLAGKTPVALARLAQAQNIPCIALCGSVDDAQNALGNHGISAAFSLCQQPLTLAQAIAKAAPLLSQLASQVAQVYSLHTTPKRSNTCKNTSGSGRTR